MADTHSRAAFVARLHPLVGQARRGALTFAVHRVGLDRFRFLDDLYGIEATDALRRAVGDRLFGALRASDTVALLESDEFVVIQADRVDPEAAGILARKILRALAEPIALAGRQHHLAASVGVALFPSDGEDAEGVLRAAGIALRDAEAGGPGQVRFFDPALGAATGRRLTLEDALREAVARGELAVHYQPRVAVPTGAVVGMEALARWVHPVLGAISPSEFIPLAEASSLILELGEWVLREACQQARAWRDAGVRPLQMAVNLSAVQFRQPSLVELVRDVLAESGLPPDALELELTESVLIDDLEASAARLGELRALGVRVAIDDFGTGYSSLSYLRQLPVDVLKIDRAFVAGTPGDPRDVALLRTIVALGRSLGLTVLAEGVETTPQLELLRELGCEQFQGFLFSRAVPPEDFLATIAPPHRVSWSRPPLAAGLAVLRLTPTG